MPSNSKPPEISYALLVLCQMMERCGKSNADNILKVAERQGTLITPEVEQLLRTCSELAFFTGVKNGVANFLMQPALASEWHTQDPDVVLSTFRMLQQVRRENPELLKNIDEFFNARVQTHEMGKGAKEPAQG